jgi:hypothetical protein
MGPEPEIDAAADDEGARRSYPGPGIHIRHNLKSENVENISQQKRDKPKNKHLSLRQGQEKVPTKAEAQTYQKKTGVSGYPVGRNQDDQNEQEGKKRLGRHKTLTIFLVLKIEDAGKQNCRPKDDQNTPHDTSVLLHRKTLQAPAPVRAFCPYQ